MTRRKPARLLLMAGAVKADKRQIREITRRWEDLYRRLGIEPRMLLATARPVDGDGPEAA